MSDGPHRSLPMRPWWKQAALRADKSAFDVSECTEAIEVVDRPRRPADLLRRHAHRHHRQQDL